MKIDLMGGSGVSLIPRCVIFWEYSVFANSMKLRNYGKLEPELHRSNLNPEQETLHKNHPKKITLQVHPKSSIKSEIPP
jgi:hypothetical protein